MRMAQRELSIVMNMLFSSPKCRFLTPSTLQLNGKISCGPCCPTRCDHCRLPPLRSPNYSSDGILTWATSCESVTQKQVDLRTSVFSILLYFLLCWQFRKGTTYVLEMGVCAMYTWIVMSLASSFLITSLMSQFSAKTQITSNGFCEISISIRKQLQTATTIVRIWDVAIMLNLTFIQLSTYA